MEHFSLLVAAILTLFCCPMLNNHKVRTACLLPWPPLASGFFTPTLGGNFKKFQNCWHTPITIKKLHVVFLWYAIVTPTSEMYIESGMWASAVELHRVLTLSSDLSQVQNLHIRILWICTLITLNPFLNSIERFSLLVAAIPTLFCCPMLNNHKVRTACLLPHG